MCFYGSGSDRRQIHFYIEWWIRNFFKFFLGLIFCIFANIFIITVASFNFSEDKTFQFEFVKMILFFHFPRIIFTVTEPESGVEPKKGSGAGTTILLYGQLPLLLQFQAVGITSNCCCIRLLD